LDARAIPMVDDGGVHHVRIVLAAPNDTAALRRAD